MLEIRTFGGLQLTTAGRTVTGLASRKAEALLVYLAVTGRPQSREVLADFFWDERSQTQAMANLRTVLSSLRQNIGDYLDISRDYAAIRPEADVWLDLQEFEQQLGAARLENAIAIYQGEFLAGFNIRDSRGFEDWLVQERQNCQEQLQQGLHAWVRYHIERGSCQEGIVFAEQLLVIDPLDEVAFRQLMVLLALTGQQAGLVRRYEGFCQQLASELGVEPFQETQDLYHDLVAGKLSQVVGVRGLDARQPRVVEECPYRGLAHFREVDAPFFFGREAFTAHLAAAVENDSLVTVIVGASGSGKSSAVYAGLLPRLRRQGNWQVVTLRPGHRPFERLAGALLPMLESNLDESARLEKTGKLAFDFQHTPGALNQQLETLRVNGNEPQRILLMIDQFEELYTLCQQAEVRHGFLDALLSVVNGSPDQQANGVVLLQTLRADFMGQALAYRPFADTMQKAALMLGPMTRDELRAVIVKPAEKQGAAFEPGLVERILKDVGDEPGNLPLLEFALTLLWERLDHGWFTHAAYEEIGGVAGALTRYAEQVFATLDQDQQEQLRKIFVQLVQPGEGSEDTRRVATRDELAGSDWDLVRHLADQRLVVTNVDSEGIQTVEVVHEALIRSWDRLGHWMEEDRAFRSWQEGLRTDIRHWQAHEQDEGDLLRGRSLAQAEGWLAERPAELSESAQGFILASIELRDRRERERATRRRRIFAGLAAGLVLTIILAAVAFNQRNESLRAYSLSVAAHVQNALELNENDLSLALALAATDINNPPAAVARALREAAYSPGPLKMIDVAETFGMDEMPWSMAVSPIEFISLIGFGDGTLILWNVETGEEIRRLVGHSNVVSDVAFSPDGKTALSGSYDQTVILWDLDSGQILRRFEGHSGWIRTVTFSPDGSMAATGGFSSMEATGGYVGTVPHAVNNPGELIIWEVNTGQEIVRLEGHPSGVQEAVFTPDGSKLLASSGFFAALSNPASLYLWDIAQGQIIHTFELDYDAYSLAVDPSGTIAASASIQDINIWNLESGERITNLSGHGGMPRYLSYTPGGDHIVSVDSNGQLIEWNAATWGIEMQAQVQLHVSGSWSDSSFAMTQVALGPQGRYAITSADDNTLVVWDLYDAGQLQKLVGHESTIGGVAITPDGRYALTGSGSFCFCGIPGMDNSVRFWDVATGEQIHLLEGHQDLVTAVDMTPDGRLGLSGSSDGSLRLWDLENGVELNAIENAHTGGVFTAVISPDGRYALSGSVTGGSYPDDGVKLWDLQTGEMVHYYNDENDNNTKIVINPDGRSAYAGILFLNLLDFDTGEITRLDSPMPNGGCCVGFAVSSDGTIVYGAENSDTILRSWVIETGELIQEFGVHGGNRTRVELSNDDQVLLSSSVFGGMYLWDVDTGDLLRSWNHAGINLEIDMTADGTVGISSGPQTTGIIWNLALPLENDEVKAWIKENRVVRELTCEERLTYSIEPLCEGELAVSP